MVTDAQARAAQEQADADWVVVINGQIDALPQTLADVADPYTVGRMEAEQGLPCEPLTHYARLGDIEQYIIGHKDATATLDATAQHFGLILGAMMGGRRTGAVDGHAGL